MKTVEIKSGNILLDGVKTQIISGAIHYFRVHPDLLDDRLDKAVAFGLNTIETYIPWNLHEPRPGKYCFEGIADVEKFIDKVHERNLNMILRPGPYICAEWDNGGLPAWLVKQPGVELRRMNKPYLDAVKRYFDVLLPKLQKKCCTNDGPVILMQLENEYGSYGHDKDYLRYLAELYRAHNIDIPYFTSDGWERHYLLGGTLPDVFMTLNFGSMPENAFKSGRTMRPEGPDFCMEFWNGWFDHWGEAHQSRNVQVADTLEKMLAAGANVNFYMFHGGTNFGFYNGANGNLVHEYRPTVTSYDYDCPLSECGDPTPKFFACQKVLAKYSCNPAIKEVSPSKKITPMDVELTQSAALLDNLSTLTNQSGQAVTPPVMEDLGENFGFIHYRTRLDGPLPAPPEGTYQAALRLLEVNDFAQVWVDGQYLGSRWRDNGENVIPLPSIPETGSRLDILVENCGRINYGPRLGKDFKGITGGVAVALQMRFNWQYNTLPMSDLSKLEFAAFSNKPTTFHRGFFDLEDVGDAFLLRPGVKGLVWINGFNLGRYWDRGPTETLYIPSPVLKKGRNEIIVLELEKLASDAVKFSPAAILGKENPEKQA